MREFCESFSGFRMYQDVWVSPSNGVKYIGSTDNLHEPQWELKANGKSLGRYHRLIIAHNGKCADRIMSKTPAKEFHSLLRTRFGPSVPQWGGSQMTLNSIYSLVFAVKTQKGAGSPIAEALSKLSPGDENVYTVMIKNQPNLRLLSSNTLKHKHHQAAGSESNIEVYTLLSSAAFGKKFKGPQENLPVDLTEKVVVKMFESLERSLELNGSIADIVVDLKLQLWGAAVPVNTWVSRSNKVDPDGFVWDGEHGVGAVGDWILDSSIAGAWESGRRLASHILCDSKFEPPSVGLPSRLTNDEGPKFIPSNAALVSGVGSVPTSTNEQFVFSSNGQNRGEGRGRGRGQGRGRGGRGGRGRGGRGGRGRGGRDNNNARRRSNNAAGMAPVQ